MEALQEASSILRTSGGGWHTAVIYLPCSYMNCFEIWIPYGTICHSDKVKRRKKKSMIRKIIERSKIRLPWIALGDEYEVGIVSS